MPTTLPPHPSADPVTSRTLQVGTSLPNAYPTRFDAMRKARPGRLRRLGPVPGRDDLRTLTLDDLRAATGRTG